MRKVTIFRVPCPYNANKTFLIKKYKDGHYYLNQELFVMCFVDGVLTYKRERFNRCYVRVSRRWINEMLKPIK